MKQNSSIQMFTDYEGDLPDLNIKVNGEIPIFVTRNLVMFPGILSPILVGRKATLAFGEKYRNHHCHCKSEG